MNDVRPDAREQVVAALPRLRRFARSLTRDATDADDLVQTAVERALLRIDQWRPDSSLLSWLFGIVRNAWIDEARVRRRRGELFAPDDGVERVGDATTTDVVELLAIQSALGRLPDEQRLAVGLVLVEGLSYREAAAVLGVPIGTLTSRLARGRVALESMLGVADGPGAGPEGGE